MGRLLLVAALALAISAADSLITTRDSSTTDTSSDTVIGSAASDSTKATETPATETPATTAPTISESEGSSTSSSNDQETTDAPSSASATVGPASSADRSTASQTQASTATASSSTAAVDTLNDNSGALSTGDSSSMATVLPIVFGALACVGALVMAVTYKKKRDASAAESDNRLCSDCEYTSGADFTPDNRALSVVREDSPPVAIRVPAQAQNSAEVGAPAIADFTGTNSTISVSSPFGSTRCKARVSSPVPSFCSSSDTNTEFQDTCPRHEEGSNVVLTFDEVQTASSHVAPQVQL
ncbi:unnamed protein product [Phytophthora lilii]|uniref:Unnamed protein product n=1 Tax=Phytophthora lilii TaxID=2077276 RepID=A0A9W6U7C3_9STRA|nr:unnamed protein product [Phytophthora lilii]